MACLFSVSVVVSLWNNGARHIISELNRIWSIEAEKWRTSIWVWVFMRIQSRMKYEFEILASVITSAANLLSVGGAAEISFGCGIARQKKCFCRFAENSIWCMYKIQMRCRMELNVSVQSHLIERNRRSVNCWLNKTEFLTVCFMCTGNPTNRKLVPLNIAPNRFRLPTTNRTIDFYFSIFLP